MPAPRTLSITFALSLAVLAGCNVAAPSGPEPSTAPPPAPVTTAPTPPVTTTGPAPVTTAAPTTTKPPTTTAAPTTTKPPTTTAAPTTTEPPTTTTTPTTSDPNTPAAVAGLDASGKTIPATNYPIPSGAVFMSPSGNDANSGTLAAPVKTFTRAITLTPAGGTIVLRGGEHRSSYTNTDGTIRAINRSITIQAYPGEQPWFTGSDIVSDGWTADGSRWVRDWSTPQFCNAKYNVAVGGVSPVSPYLSQNSPCAYADSISDPAFPVAGDPQLAFVNGVQMTQVGSLTQVTPGTNTFFYDWATKKIYVSANPQANQLELATRGGLVILGGPFDFTLKGVGFHRFASTAFQSVVYAGLGEAATPNAGSFTAENVVFSENAGGTIAISGPKNGSKVSRSVFAFNHYAGFGSNGFASSAPGAPNDLTLEANIFNANNQGNFDTKCRASCGVAAVKLAHMTGFTVRDNVFENTLQKGPGMWCDLDCSDGVIVNNVVRNNGGHGIFYEVSNTGIIANNLVYHNGGSGITVCSANTKIYNNTVINKTGSNVQAIWIYDDTRIAPAATVSWPYVSPRVDLGPNTRNVELANNLIVAQQPTGARLLNLASTSDTQPNTNSSEYFSVFNHNIYYALSNQNLYMWHKTDAIKTPDQLRTVSGQQWETNSLLVSGTGDPFINRATLDFRLRNDSLAVTAGSRPIPADVADATGLRGAVPRGARR